MAAAHDLEEWLFTVKAWGPGLISAESEHPRGVYEASYLLAG